MWRIFSTGQAFGGGGSVGAVGGGVGEPGVKPPCLGIVSRIAIPYPYLVPLLPLFSLSTNPACIWSPYPGGLDSIHWSYHSVYPSG